MADAERRGDGSSAVVDWEVAIRSIPGGVAGVRQTAALMRAEAPRLIAALRAAIAGKDAKEIRRAVHTIRGAAAYFGARRVTDLASTMEAYAHEGNLGAVGAAAPELERAVDAFAAALVEAEDLDEGMGR